MKKISLDKINEKALYRVVQIEELPHLFYIHTDFSSDGLILMCIVINSIFSLLRVRWMER